MPPGCRCRSLVLNLTKLVHPLVGCPCPAHLMTISLVEEGKTLLQRPAVTVRKVGDRHHVPGRVILVIRPVASTDNLDVVVV